jgi:carboxymethylenebutenolidase
MGTFIDIKTQDGICDCFIAHPDGQGPYPAVLFLMDGFGPRAYLYEMAITIASRGYFVFMPNLFYRFRRAPVVDVKFPATPADMPELVKQLMPMYQSYNPEFGMRDAIAFFDFLSQQSQVLPGPIGITGYCFGGGLAIRIAAQFPDRIIAAACFHASNLATELPNSPHLLLNRIKAELYFGHADNDKNLPPEQIERLENALKQSGLKYEAELYKGAAHGFTMADLPAYNEEALKRHWVKLFNLLEHKLL